MLHVLRSNLITWGSVFMKLMASANIVKLHKTSGTLIRSSFRHEGLLRTFRIYLPPSYSKTQNLPVIFVLHGRGGNGESMTLITRNGFNRLADMECFIVIYPDAVEMNWNDGRKDEESNDRAHRENIDDVGFISSIIDKMIAEYSIDPRRVYITGISNGAIMAYRLACQLSGKITAIAPVDGNIPKLLPDDCYPSKPVSVLAINNSDDPLVPYEGGDIYSRFHRIKLGKVLSTAESVAYWIKRNSCTTEPLISDEPDRDPYDMTKVTVTRYNNGIEGTEVILYTVHGGGHTWPGGFQYLPEWIIGRTSRDFDANEIIWEFFKRHSR